MSKLTSLRISLDLSHENQYAVSVKFNGIRREGKPSIPIKYYKDQFQEHMIRNRMWGVFTLPDPRNTGKKWGLLLHRYIFPLDYVKRHVQSLQKGSEADQYVV